MSWPEIWARWLACERAVRSSPLSWERLPTSPSDDWGTGVRRALVAGELRVSENVGKVGSQNFASWNQVRV